MPLEAVHLHVEAMRLVHVAGVQPRDEIVPAGLNPRQAGVQRLRHTAVPVVPQQDDRM